MKVDEKTIYIQEKGIPYTHIQNDSQNVCFMFSGAGYTYDKPLFHYATMVALKNRCDVVHIHYSYKEELSSGFESVTKLMIEDVKPVVTQVLTENRYKNTIFLGKSLGTIPITQEFMQKDQYSRAHMVLLTPLLKREPILKSLIDTNQNVFLAIGDKDQHYTQEAIAQIKENANIEVKVLPGANHGLELEGFDVSGSLSTMKKTMEALDHFFNRYRDNPHSLSN